MLLTIIRHAESTGNVSQKWQGWFDAGLTNHGWNQTLRLGERFAHDKASSYVLWHWSERGLTAFQITHIYHSDLIRTTQTAQAIHKYHPNVPITATPLLREQNMGDFEDKSWIQFKLPPTTSWRDRRRQPFPNGESSEDVSKRANLILQQILQAHSCHLSGQKPTNSAPDPIEAYEDEDGIVRDHISRRQSAKTTTQEPHIVIVSHGMFINEFYGCLAQLTQTPARHIPMSNTGVTQCRLIPMLGPLGPSSTFSIQWLLTNNVMHLDGLRRQPGVGSVPYDSNQKGIKDFFGRHEADGGYRNFGNQQVDGKEGTGLDSPMSG